MIIWTYKDSPTEDHQRIAMNDQDIFMCLEEELGVYPEWMVGIKQHISQNMCNKIDAKNEFIHKLINVYINQVIEDTDNEITKLRND